MASSLGGFTVNVVSSRRRTPALLVLVASLLALAVAGPAHAAGPYPGLTDLSAAKRSKLSPRLYALTRDPLSGASANAQADGVDLPRSGAGSLVRSDSGALMVYVRVTDTSDATLGELRAAGVAPTHVSNRYRVVTGFVMPLGLSRVASVAAVRSVSEAIRPQTSRTGAKAAGKATLVGTFVTCGSRTSEGVRHIAADSARGSYEVDGTGIEVGILSDSYDVTGGDATSAAQDIASGDIPGPGNPCGRLSPVSNLDEINDTTDAIDEGRGMAQIVHDLAPGAELSFASAFNGLFSFADNIAALRAAGAEVIVDDVIYFDEPMFQKGPVDIAIANVVADGALYFTAAGNSNVIVGGSNVGSYEAPAYRPVGCPAAITAFNAGYGDCHDFDTGAGADVTDNITVNPGGGFLSVFQWAQPWNNVGTDLDVFLLNSATGAIIAGSVEDQETDPSTAIPSEVYSWSNTTGSPMTVQVVLARWSGAPAPRVKFLFAGAGGITSIQFNSSTGGDIVGPTVWGHSGTPEGFSVGAVRYDTRTTPEAFSSRGPRTLYFGPADGTTPAGPLGAPQVVAVPHMAATDGGANTFFGSNVGGTWRFFGTSAAAPHAAAAAALMWERELPGTLSRAAALSAFTATGHPVPTQGGPTAVGLGLIDALGAADLMVPTGFLRVTTSPAVPSQIVVDGEIRDNWGLEWVKVSAGQHTVSFTDVQGYATPVDQVVNVTAGNTTVVTGTFVPQALLRVLTNPAVPGTITVDGIRRNDWGMWTYFPPGAHQVCFLAVLAFLPPTCQNINLAAGTGNADVTGLYTASGGAPGEPGPLGELRVTTSPALPSQISVDGNVTDNWGLTWLKLTPGAKVVGFSDVEGWTTPANLNPNVPSGGTATVAGTFVQRGLLRVTTSPAIPGNGATVFVDGVPRNDFGNWTWYPTGSHEVCYGFVDGLFSPICQTVTLTAGNQTTVSGTYVTDP